MPLLFCFDCMHLSACHLDGSFIALLLYFVILLHNIVIMPCLYYALDASKYSQSYKVSLYRAVAGQLGRACGHCYAAFSLPLGHIDDVWELTSLCYPVVCLSGLLYTYQAALTVSHHLLP